MQEIKNIYREKLREPSVISLVEIGNLSVWKNIFMSRKLRKFSLGKKPRNEN